MSIRLTVQVKTPLTDEDRDLLSGLSVFTMALATRGKEEEAPQEEEAERPFQAVLFEIDDDGHMVVHEAQTPEELDDIVARAQEAVRRCEGMSVTGITQCILEKGHDGIHRFEQERVN